MNPNNVMFIFFIADTITMEMVIGSKMDPAISEKKLSQTLKYANQLEILN